MLNMKKLLLMCVVLCSALFAQAQSIIGTWKTIDDETNEPKSYLQLYEENGQLKGKVVRLLKSAPDKLCTECPGERKDKPILNMIVVEDMRMQDGYYQGGRILDPEKGKWYTCKMWLKDGDPNTLVVRGYVSVFYRTQNWYRVQ
jgi:uncharacterized protein (DUF2147 family)